MTDTGGLPMTLRLILRCLEMEKCSAWRMPHKLDSLRVAVTCGSCGKKAIPLAALGADVSIFDISRDNQRYALEVAALADVTIDYQVCNVMEIDMARYAAAFDVVFMEGGVLHYFHELDAFMQVMHRLLKPGGRMICSDFHPFNKIVDALGLEQEPQGYFFSEPAEYEMAYARFMPEEIRRQMPKCVCRKYTISQIINSVVGSGFALRRFDEHPAWNNADLPGEFTIMAQKPD